MSDQAVPERIKVAIEDGRITLSASLQPDINLAPTTHNSTIERCFAEAQIIIISPGDFISLRDHTNLAPLQSGSLIADSFKVHPYNPEKLLTLLDKFQEKGIISPKERELAAEQVNNFKNRQIKIEEVKGQYRLSLDHIITIPEDLVNDDYYDERQQKAFGRLRTAGAAVLKQCQEIAETHKVEFKPAAPLYGLNTSCAVYVAHNEKYKLNNFIEALGEAGLITEAQKSLGMALVQEATMVSSAAHRMR